jgi:hypothetical protein
VAVENGNFIDWTESGERDSEDVSLIKSVGARRECQGSLNTVLGRVHTGAIRYESDMDREDT